MEYRDGDADSATSTFVTGMSAITVLGQPNLTSNADNHVVVTASTLNQPQDVTGDGSNNLWVADTANNRALLYSTPFVTGEAAGKVLGHSMLTTGNPNDMGTVDDRSLFGPGGLAFAGTNLIVSDTNNNRVLQHNSAFVTNQQASVSRWS